MISDEVFAKVLYEHYCIQVGGKAFNGDPLPSWDDFRADPTKEKQSDAWIRTAQKAISFIENLKKDQYE